jgi:hypothetical protein
LYSSFIPIISLTIIRISYWSIPTHVYDGWTEDIQADKVVLTWVVRAKTADEISAAEALLAISYKHDRAMEYPTIEECVHAILDDDLTALQVKRQAVKDKYPKP